MGDPPPQKKIHSLFNLKPLPAYAKQKKDPKAKAKQKQVDKIIWQC